jgi:hypothetical protein
LNEDIENHARWLDSHLVPYLAHDLSFVCKWNDLTIADEWPEFQISICILRILWNIHNMISCSSAPFNKNARYALHVTRQTITISKWMRREKGNFRISLKRFFIIRTRNSFAWFLRMLVCSRFTASKKFIIFLSCVSWRLMLSRWIVSVCFILINLKSLAFAKWKRHKRCN